MKRTAVFGIVSIFLLALVFLAACSNDKADLSSTEDLPEPNNLWTIKDGVTARLMQDSYRVGTTEMTVILENRTDDIFFYGNGWSFSKYIDGKWCRLDENGGGDNDLILNLLVDHYSATIHVTTWHLKEPLDSGLYCLNGASYFEVRGLDENFEYKYDRVKYPPYQLEFIVSETAAPEPTSESKKEPDQPWQLPEIEDWQWYTQADCIMMYYIDVGLMVRQVVRGDNGLFAALYQESPYVQKFFSENKYFLDIIDRKTGKRYEVLTQPAVGLDKVTPYKHGFKVFCDDVLNCSINDDDTISLTPFPADG